MTGRVEVAVRGAVPFGSRLPTPTGRGEFSVARYSTDGLVLLMGERRPGLHCRGGRSKTFPNSFVVEDGFG